MLDKFKRFVTSPATEYAVAGANVGTTTSVVNVEAKPTFLKRLGSNPYLLTALLTFLPVSGYAAYQTYQEEGEVDLATTIASGMAVAALNVSIQSLVGNSREVDPFLTRSLERAELQNSKLSKHIEILERSMADMLESIRDVNVDLSTSMVELKASREENRRTQGKVSSLTLMLDQIRTDYTSEELEPQQTSTRVESVYSPQASSDSDEGLLRRVEKKPYIEMDGLDAKVDVAVSASTEMEDEDLEKDYWEK